MVDEVGAGGADRRGEDHGRVHGVEDHGERGGRQVAVAGQVGALARGQRDDDVALRGRGDEEAVAGAAAGELADRAVGHAQVGGDEAGHRLGEGHGHRDRAPGRARRGGGDGRGGRGVVEHHAELRGCDVAVAGDVVDGRVGDVDGDLAVGGGGDVGGVGGAAADQGRGRAVADGEVAQDEAGDRLAEGDLDGDDRVGQGRPGAGDADGRRGGVVGPGEGGRGGVGVVGRVGDLAGGVGHRHRALTGRRQVEGVGAAAARPVPHAAVGDRDLRHVEAGDRLRKGQRHRHRGQVGGGGGDGRAEGGGRAHRVEHHHQAGGGGIEVAGQVLGLARRQRDGDVALRGRVHGEGVGGAAAGEARDRAAGHRQVGRDEAGHVLAEGDGHREGGVGGALRGGGDGGGRRGVVEGAHQLRRGEVVVAGDVGALRRGHVHGHRAVAGRGDDRGVGRAAAGEAADRATADGDVGEGEAGDRLVEGDLDGDGGVGRRWGGRGDGGGRRGDVVGLAEHHRGEVGGVARRGGGAGAGVDLGAEHALRRRGHREGVDGGVDHGEVAGQGVDGGEAGEVEAGDRLAEGGGEGDDRLVGRGGGHRRAGDDDRGRGGRRREAGRAAQQQAERPARSRPRDVLRSPEDGPDGRGGRGHGVGGGEAHGQTPERMRAQGMSLRREDGSGTAGCRPDLR